MLTVYVKSSLPCPGTLGLSLVVKSKRYLLARACSFGLRKRAKYGMAQRPIRSVCIREDSDSDPIGGFRLRLGEDLATIQMHRMSSRLCSLLNKKLFTQTPLGADFHHFIIHRPAFWQPRRIHHKSNRQNKKECTR